MVRGRAGIFEACGARMLGGPLDPWAMDLWCMVHGFAARMCKTGQQRLRPGQLAATYCMMDSSPREFTDRPFSSPSSAIAYSMESWSNLFLLAESYARNAWVAFSCHAAGPRLLAWGCCTCWVAGATGCSFSTTACEARAHSYPVVNQQCRSTSQGAGWWAEGKVAQKEDLAQHKPFSALGHPLHACPRLGLLG